MRVWLDTDGFTGPGLQVVPLEAVAHFTDLFDYSSCLYLEYV